ncbi:MAG: hypothetical protein JST46_09465 [Bacteroidetes bacterium]|nr:hypothetical protein [Bacteroidota bacterium]
MKQGALIFTFLICVVSAIAQDKASVRLGLTFRKVNDEPAVLRCEAKTKAGKRFEPVENAIVNIYFSEENNSNLIGTTKTNGKGIADVNVPASFLTRMDSTASWHFVATLTEGETYKGASAEADVTRARLQVDFQEADSTRTIVAILSEWKDGKWTPVPQTEVKLIVKTLFSDLPVGEDTYTTDDEGKASTTFDMKLPGDAEGNLTLGAKLEDHEAYGTLFATSKMKWGVPTPPDNSFSQRTLWASRDKTPWWLLIGPNLIILAVWGSIFYLVYLFVKIRRSGMQKT